MKDKELRLLREIHALIIFGIGFISAGIGITMFSLIKPIVSFLFLIYGLGMMILSFIYSSP